MKPRLATIDLEYIEDQILKIRNNLERSKFDNRHIPPHVFFKAGLDMLDTIYSKCTPIQEQTINGYVVTKGEWTNATIEDQKVTEFLSKTCINDWESNAYCSNQNKCQMCKIKQ